MKEHYDPNAKYFHYHPRIFDAALACGWELEGKPDRLRLLTSSAVEYGRDVESRYVHNVTAEQLTTMLKAARLGWRFHSLEFNREEARNRSFPITIVLSIRPRQLLRIKPDGSYVK